jgi:adenosylcobinamide kinase/adenosylcobinamide-phosphate guanylyltransferase
VDDELLVDAGPDVPRAAARFGVGLGALRHLLVGHAHPDHLGPEALMWRSWSTAADRPLDVVGPPAVLDVVRAFLTRWEGGEPGGPGSALRLVPAFAGTELRLGGDLAKAADRASPAVPAGPGVAAGPGVPASPAVAASPGVPVGSVVRASGDGPAIAAGPAITAGPAIAAGGEAAAGYLVRPVPAHHGDASIGPAVLYDITAPDGGRLLYACDTGPLPAATVDALAGRAFDVALIEENNGDRPGFGDHLDLTTFTADVERLRGCAALTDRSTVVAVHLSHRNPPGPALATRLAALGVELLPDGAVLDAPPGVRARRVTAPGT